MITKNAYEEFFRYHEFLRTDGKGWLNASETISTCTVTIADKATGTDASGAMISDVAPYNNTAVRYKLKAGAAGTIYIIKIQITSSNNQKFEDTLELKVI